MSVHCFLGCLLQHYNMAVFVEAFRPEFEWYPSDTRDADKGMVPVHTHHRSSELHFYLASGALADMSDHSLKNHLSSVVIPMQAYNFPSKLRIGKPSSVTAPRSETNSKTILPTYDKR